MARRLVTLLLVAAATTATSSHAKTEFGQQIMGPLRVKDPSTDTPLTPQSVEVEKPIGKAASSSIVQAPPKVSAPSNKGRIGPAAPLIAPLEVSAPDTIEPAAPYSIAQAPLKVSAPSKKSEISNGAASSIAQAPLKVTALPSTQTKKWPIASSPKPSRPTWEDWPKNYDDCKLCICEARIPSTFNPVRWPSSKTTQPGLLARRCRHCLVPMAT